MFDKLKTKKNKRRYEKQIASSLTAIDSNFYSLKDKVAEDPAINSELNKLDAILEKIRHACKIVQFNNKYIEAANIVSNVLGYLEKPCYLESVKYVCFVVEEIYNKIFVNKNEVSLIPEQVHRNVLVMFKLDHDIKAINLKMNELAVEENASKNLENEEYKVLQIKKQSLDRNFQNQVKIVNNDIKTNNLLEENEFLKTYLSAYTLDDTKKAVEENLDLNADRKAENLEKDRLLNEVFEPLKSIDEVLNIIDKVKEDAKADEKILSKETITPNEKDIILEKVDNLCNVVSSLQASINEIKKQEDDSNVAKIKQIDETLNNFDSLLKRYQDAIDRAEDEYNSLLVPKGYYEEIMSKLNKKDIVGAGFKIRDVIEAYCRYVKGVDISGDSIFTTDYSQSVTKNVYKFTLCGFDPVTADEINKYCYAGIEDIVHDNFNITRDLSKLDQHVSNLKKSAQFLKNIVGDSFDTVDTFDGCITFLKGINNRIDYLLDECGNTTNIPSQIKKYIFFACTNHSNKIIDFLKKEYNERFNNFVKEFGKKIYYGISLDRVSDKLYIKYLKESTNE